MKLEKDVEHGKLAPATLKRTRWLLTKYFLPTLGCRPIRLIQLSEVFPAPRDSNRPIHAGAINSVLRCLGYRRDEMTAHGYRTTASNLLPELGFGSDAIELQLAHSLPGRLRRIYNHAQ